MSDCGKKETANRFISASAKIFLVAVLCEIARVILSPPAGMAAGDILRYRVAILAGISAATHAAVAANIRATRRRVIFEHLALIGHTWATNMDDRSIMFAAVSYGIAGGALILW